MALSPSVHCLIELSVPDDDANRIVSTNLGPRVKATEKVHEAVFDLVQKYFASPVSILDLGAGEGAFSFGLMRRSHRVCAVDANKNDWKLNGVELQTLNLDNEFAQPIKREQNFDANRD